MLVYGRGAKINKNYESFKTVHAGNNTDCNAYLPIFYFLIMFCF